MKRRPHRKMRSSMALAELMLLAMGRLIEMVSRAWRRTRQ